MTWFVIKFFTIRNSSTYETMLASSLCSRPLNTLPRMSRRLRAARSGCHNADSAIASNFRVSHFCKTVFAHIVVDSEDGLKKVKMPRKFVYAVGRARKKAAHMEGFSF